MKRVQQKTFVWKGYPFEKVKTLKNGNVTNVSTVVEFEDLEKERIPFTNELDK